MSASDHRSTASAPSETAYCDRSRACKSSHPPSSCPAALHRPPPPWPAKKIRRSPKIVSSASEPTETYRTGDWCNRYRPHLFLSRGRTAYSGTSWTTGSRVVSCPRLRFVCNQTPLVYPGQLLPAGWAGRNGNEGAFGTFLECIPGFAIQIIPDSLPRRYRSYKRLHITDLHYVTARWINYIVIDPTLCETATPLATGYTHASYADH